MFIFRVLTAWCLGGRCRRAAKNWDGNWRAKPRVEADIVVPVPDSGVTAAMGYAAESGIPFRFGLIRNHYVGRTFIEPQQSVRDFGVKLKLNPVRSLLEGKRVVLIDDSIVRGTTSRKIVRMVRNAGAKEVHMRISCPPTISPCFYGVDTPSKKQLIAANKSRRGDSRVHRRGFAGVSLARGLEEGLRRWREDRLLHGLLHGQVSHELGGCGGDSAGSAASPKVLVVRCQVLGSGIARHHGSAFSNLPLMS